MKFYMLFKIRMRFHPLGESSYAPCTLIGDASVLKHIAILINMSNGKRIPRATACISI